MPSFDLVPDETPRGRGQHGEQIDTALLDAACAGMLDLYLSIDNKTLNVRTAKGWVIGKMNNQEPLEYEKVADIFDRIADRIAIIHANLTAARQQVNRNGKAES